MKNAQNAPQEKPGASTTAAAAPADHAKPEKERRTPWREHAANKAPEQAENQPLPDPQEVARLYAEIAEHASKLLTGHMQRVMKNGISIPSDELGIAKAFMEMSQKMLSNPVALMQQQMALVQDYVSLWQSSVMQMFGAPKVPVAVPKKGDGRFKDEEWEKNFLFDFIKQSYLITARHIYDAVADVKGLDANDAKKTVFYTRQFIDTLSPSNFALTNPSVLRETIKTRGQNLLQGFNNLLHDMEDGDGQLRIRMTDASAFEMGKNVAVTPGKVIFQNEMMQLIQFMPTTDEQLKRPLLIIPPWINKYYILDLRQSNSFIKWATDQGHSVFVISWVNPDEKLADKGFDAYLSEGALTAIDKVCEQTGEQELNLIGYCLGGTLLGSAMAYTTAKKDHRIASATFFVALLDFSIPGDLGVFIDEQQVSSLEKKMAVRGFLEGHEMAVTFNMLRSNDLIWSFVINNYLMGKDPFPFDLLFWNSDSTRMPYKMHSFYLRNMYMNNLLRVPGGITLLDTPIDLSKVKTPSYFISTIEDHIAPWKGTYLGAGALGGPIRFVLGGSGHIAGIVNPPSAGKYGYYTNETKKLPADPDEWFANAKQQPGSWWTDWQAWVTGLEGSKVPARDPLKGKFKVLDDAPGSFAKLRLDARPAK